MNNGNGHGMTDEEWLAKRRTLLTATDAPAILGVHPFKSALQVYVEKTQGFELTQQSERMRWGLLLEDAIAKAYAEETGRAVELPPERLTIHPTLPFMGASLDRIAVDPELGRMVLELKTTSMKVEDELPLFWQVQVAHQMEVAQLTRASVAVLNPTWGYEFIWRDIEKNERFTQALVRRLEEFWNENVLKRIPPAPDASESAARALAALYSASKDVTVELPEESTTWAREFHEAQVEIKRWEARKAAAQNAICAAMGEASVGIATDGSRFTWRSEHRAGFAVGAKDIRVFRARRGTAA